MELKVKKTTVTMLAAVVVVVAVLALLYFYVFLPSQMPSIDTTGSDSDTDSDDFLDNNLNIKLDNNSNTKTDSKIDSYKRKTDLECFLCFDIIKKPVILMPCKHIGICELCASLVQAHDNICPICRKIIISIEKIYIA